MAAGWLSRAVRGSDMGGAMANVQVAGVGVSNVSVAARAAGKTEEGKECGRHSAAEEAGHEHRVHGVLTS